MAGRLKDAIDAGIPVTNYGMAIAWTKGIFQRAIEPFEMERSNEVSIERCNEVKSRSKEELKAAGLGTLGIGDLVDMKMITTIALRIGAGEHGLPDSL